MLSSLTDRSQRTFALSAAPHMTSYMYDAGDRLPFTYDADNRVASVTCNTVTPYSYDTANRLPSTRIYVFGSYIDEPLRMTSLSGVYYYHANQIYSVAALTDSTGAAVERYTYDPYGKATVLDGAGSITGIVSSKGNPWTFTGRRLDGETGLMYYRARMYSTELGRFVGRDAWRKNASLPRALDGYNDHQDFYSYVDNAPQKYTDPSGFKKCTIKRWDVPLKIFDQLFRAISKPEYKGGIFYRRHVSEVEFENDADSCCECCEFRLHVSGTYKRDGKKVDHMLPDGPIDPTMPQEDGVAGNPPKRIGYRSDRPSNRNQYSNPPANNPHTPDPKKLQGCFYALVDDPGIGGNPGEHVEADLWFIGEVVDTCNGHKTVKMSEWRLKIDGVVPTEAEYKAGIEAQQKERGVQK